MSEVEISNPKPSKVTYAIIILCVYLLLGIVNSFILNLTTTLIDYSSIQVLITTAITWALIIFFIYQINLGKKWARTTFLILFIIGILIFPFSFISTIKASLVVGIVEIVQVIMQIIALILLFSKESNAWYNYKKQVSNANQ